MSMKLKRTIQEWRNLDPVHIAQRQGRPVAKHALVDAKHDILALAAKVEELAAAAVQGEPGVKWAPEEVANGNKGIRWVSDEGVHGRPTDHDCRVYLESNPNARGCHCPECTMLYTAPQPAEQQPDVTQLVEALEASTHRLHEQADGEDDCRCSQCRFVRLRDAALAAHRKGGCK